MNRTAAFITALTLIVLIAGPQRVHAQRVTVPFVPANIRVPAGNQAYLVAHAVGTQAYICLPSGATMAWTFFGPQATLFDDDSGRQVITHFLSPNRPKTAPRVRPGNTPVIRARSGRRRSRRPRIPRLSRPAPFLGCFCRLPVPRMARPAAPG